jgi:multidrug resistance protein, MATE family
MRFIRDYFKGYYQPGGMKDLLVMALPMMVSSSCDGIMTFTDRFFLSKTGSEQMNAAMGGFVTYQMLIFFFMGLIGYSSALVAQYYGAGQKSNAPVVTFQALLMALFSWPVVVLLKPLAVGVFTGMNLPENQAVFQTQYVDVLVWGAVFTLFRQVMGCYFTGIGKAKVVMNATLSALVLNIVLDYLLIFGKLGLPAMGVKGAAIATVTGNAVAFLYFALSYFKRKNVVEFAVMRSFRVDWSILKRIFRYGYPAGLEIFLNFVAFFLMTLMFQSQGSSAATATTIMFSYDMLSFIPLIGIEIATTSLVGRHMGAENPELAYKTAWSAAKMGLMYSALVLIVFLGIPELLVMVFQPDGFDPSFEAAIPLAKSMIRIASLYVLAQAVMVALIGTLRGAGDTFYTMLISVGANWVFIPLQYSILYVLKASIPVAWFGLILVYLVFCWVMYLRFRSGKWKLLRIIQ